MEQVLQGNIDRFTLPEIFQLIANSHKTGTLGIQKDDDIIMIYFEKGQIIYGYGPRKTYHIGQLLRERGRITAEQLEEAVTMQSKKASSERLGQILIQKGYIDRTDLEKVVREQVEELIYSILSWQSGSFKFYENQYPTQEEIKVNISVENAILEGCRRIDEINRTREVLPDFETVLTIAPSPAERRTDISLQAEEWNLLSLVNGRRSINEIVEISNLDKVITLQKLAALKLAGLITETIKKGEEESDRLAVMVDRVSRLLEEYLSHKSKSVPDEKTTIQSPTSRLNPGLIETELAPVPNSEEN
jgi:hypothetical protein